MKVRTNIKAGINGSVTVNANNAAAISVSVGSTVNVIDNSEN
jgi:hypothetical protein